MNADARRWVTVAVLALGCGPAAAEPPRSEAELIEPHEPAAAAPSVAVSASASDEGRPTAPVGAPMSGPVVTEGSISDVKSVTARMAPRFRRCFVRGLQTNPNMTGSMRITTKIGANGEVLFAFPLGGEGLSAEVLACCTSVVAQGTFPPPEGGGATVVIPVVFVGK